MRAVNSFLSIAAIAAGALMFFPGESSGLPSYARQSAGSCFDCHSKTSQSLSSIELLPAAGSEKLSFQGRTFLSGSPSENLKAGLKIYTEQRWTGLNSSERLLSNSSGFDPLRIRGGGEDAANSQTLTGFSGFIRSDMFMASIGLLYPSIGFNPLDKRGGDASVWYRFAFTPKLGGLGLTLGVFGAANSSDGNSLMGKDDVEDFVSARSFGFDAQIQGKIGKMSVDLKTIYSNIGIENIRLAPGAQPADITDSFKAMAMIGFNDIFGFSAAYRTYNTFGSSTVGGSVVPADAASIGAWISLSENIVLQPQFTTYKINEQLLDTDSEFSLRFFSGF